MAVAATQLIDCSAQEPQRLCELAEAHVDSRHGIPFAARDDLQAKPAVVAVRTLVAGVRGQPRAARERPHCAVLLHQLARAGKSMTVLSGDDAAFLPLLSLGAHGVVSVASNLFPRAMVAIPNQRGTAP